MQRLFATLSEKDRRRYAEIDAAKLGHGGIEYLSGLFGIDPKTVRKGLAELEQTDDPAPRRVRRKGGGRKTAMERRPQLDENFRQILAEFTAGDPMREGVLWTNLSRREISRRLAELGTPASRHTVRKLMKKHGLGQRKVRKKKTLGAHPDRDGQFQNIARIKAEYLAAGDPVISIDTKKKELIGNFAREGHTHTQVSVDVLDHDFPSAREGKLFPHITRACQGVVLHSLALAKQFMEKARTSKGLTVTVDILAGVYETGRKCAADFIETMRIVFDEYLPRGNYRAIPLAN